MSVPISTSIHNITAIVVEEVHKLNTTAASYCRTLKVVRSGEVVFEVVLFGNTPDSLYLYDEDGDNLEVLPCGG